MGAQQASSDVEMIRLWLDRYGSEEHETKTRAAYRLGICSSRLNDRFAVQDSANCPISIGTPSCCGANDGSNASEQIGSPLGTESTCNFAVCGCGPQFPLAAIVIRWNVRMLQEGEKVAAHPAITFAQPLAVLVGGCQHHDRVQLAIQPA